MDRVVPHDALGVALSYWPCRVALLESLFDPTVAPKAAAAAVFEDAVVAGHDLWFGQGPLNRPWTIVKTQAEKMEGSYSDPEPELPPLLKASLAYDPNRRLWIDRPRDEDGDLLLRINTEIPLANVDLSFDARTVTDDIGPKLQQLTSLVRLNLSVSKLGDNGMANIAKCPLLSELVLVGNPITSDSGKHVAGLSETLCLLDVSESLIGDAFFSHLAETTMPMLESLQLLNCSNVSGTCATDIATFRSLKRLHMGFVMHSSYRASSMTEDTFGTAAAAALGCPPRLEELWVPRMRGGDESVAQLLPHAPRLTSLNLMRLDISDDAGVILAQLKNLKSLCLAHCMGITDNIGEHLGTLTALELLDLEGCTALTNNVAPYLLPLKSLKVVVMNACPGVGKAAATTMLEELPRLENVLVDPLND